MTKDLVALNAVTDIVEAVRGLPVIKKEDANFLIEHKEHLAAVLENSQMWRTDTQKRSIISDLNCPTAHSKFHQAILEQKVQFDQTMYLAKDFEMKKLDMEELECDLEELGNVTDYSKRDEIISKKLQIDIQFKQYELKQMQTAMNYRMAEVKGWQELQEELLTFMRSEKVSEEDIWSKDAGENSAMFLTALSNYASLPSLKDSGEIHNVNSLAQFVYRQAKQSGKLKYLKGLCNSVQLKALEDIEIKFK